MITSHKKYFILFIFLLLFSVTWAQPIDRKALVERHNVINTKYDSLSSLSVGNGGFAFTVDVTGLQTFPEAYGKGVPLGTQSEWGWHSFKDTANYQFDETLKSYKLNGRYVPYGVQIKEPERNRNAGNWFRVNPHRLQLGNIGFNIVKKNGTAATLTDIKNIYQTLNQWTGEIHSTFTIENIPVEVFTYCHQQQDMIAVKVISPFLKANRLQIRLRFPYPNGDFKDVGTNWSNDSKQQSVLTNKTSGAIIHRTIDSTNYYVQLEWKGKAMVQQKQKHDFVVKPAASNVFEMSCRFLPESKSSPLQTFDQTAKDNKRQWFEFWQTGAAVDFSGSTNAKAFELERRIILSQYLTKIQCAGNYPPQETGLTYNSWYGKPHLEMHWWHAIHFALWGRTELLEKSLSWYGKVCDEAKKIAVRQGYEGVRWQKMTDNDGRESPSSVGAFLIWQQPHLIYFSELVYRDHNDINTLNKYKDLVFATADFMASYAYYDAATGRYILGKGLIPAQEKFKAEDTFNPTYELVYWYWALTTAQKWRERLHLPRNKKWDDVINRLSPLPIQNDKYLFTENGTDSYTNQEYRGDHPSVLGAMGMLPVTPMMDTTRMQHTFNWIWTNWRWKDTWGWDFPMIAMTATRLGMADKAVDALLMPTQKNTYLNNGHNYQDDRLTIYLPGNGGLLAAIAIMCAGYEGSEAINPGIPKNDGWSVKWEGLKKMF
ncbi:MAG: hypothetical protein ABIS69_09980 [Sediminibacterium sp.]